MDTTNSSSIKKSTKQFLFVASFTLLVFASISYAFGSSGDHGVSTLEQKLQRQEARIELLRDQLSDLEDNIALTTLQLSQAKIKALSDSSSPNYGEIKRLTEKAMGLQSDLGLFMEPVQ